MEIKRQFASLSDAIRAGIPLRPQTFNILFFKGGSCAYGAALEAIFGGEIVRCARGLKEENNQIVKMFPYCDQPAECPIPDCDYSRTLTWLLFHLNDNHKWTREKIADLVHEYEDSIGYETLVEESPQVIESQILRGPKFSMIG